MPRIPITSQIDQLGAGAYNFIVPATVENYAQMPNASTYYITVFVRYASAAKIIAYSIADGKTYIKTKANNVWSGWGEIALGSDLPKHATVNFSWTPPGTGNHVDIEIPITGLGISSGLNILSVTISTGSTNAYSVIRVYTTEKVWVRIFQITGLSNTSIGGLLSILYK